MHKWLTICLKAVNVRLLYFFAAVFIVPPTMMINSKGRHAIYSFYRRRMNFSKYKSSRMTYRNHYEFAKVVIDKFAMFAGKKYEIEIEGYENFSILANRPEGFMILSSHIGNFEIAGYSLVAKDKKLSALVFGAEKESITANRSRLLEENNMRLIPITQDMDYIFEINKVLSEGEILSIPADRIFGSQKYFDIEFFGAKAKFPQGPFVLSKTFGVETLFVAVMKTGVKKYKIYVRPLQGEDKSTLRKNAEKTAESYASCLEDIVRQYPGQWFNFYNFWEA